MRVDLPEFSIGNFVVEARREAVPPAERSQDIFKGARIVQPYEPARPILEELAPQVSKLACRELLPHEAFVWIYDDVAGPVHPHRDKDPDIWSVSFVLESGEHWPLYIDRRGKVTRWPVRDGEGVLMNGGRELHWRPQRSGPAAVLMLSYREQPRIPAALSIAHPEFDRAELIAEIDRDAKETDSDCSPNTVGLYKPAIGEALLRDMLPTVRGHAGVDIWPCNSFARLARHGAELREHVDRPGLDWTVSINVARDAPWYIEAEVGGEWVKYDDGAGAVLMQGIEHRHRRPVYGGQYAYQLFLHYCTDPAREGDVRIGSGRPEEA